MTWRLFPKKPIGVSPCGQLSWKKSEPLSARKTERDRRGLARAVAVRRDQHWAKLSAQRAAEIMMQPAKTVPDVDNYASA